MLTLKIALCLIAISAAGGSFLISLAFAPAPAAMVQPALELPPTQHRPMIDMNRMAAAFRH